MNAATRLLRITFAVTLLLVSVRHAKAQDTTLTDYQLLFCFQGKGSFLSYDGGVVAETFQRVPALREGKTMIAGNSSGSILAIYFACHGFSDETVQRCIERLRGGDDSAVRQMENPADKTTKMLRGLPTELPHDVLREYVAFALGVPDADRFRSLQQIAAHSQARLRHPVLIVAGNREVLDNLNPGRVMEGRNYKTHDPETHNVFWTPGVYAFYQQHPERFAREYPHLRLGPDPYIGKAETFFVDRTLFDLLSRIPAEERGGDLRLMETPADMLMAILASVSEPTYFAPIEESEPRKLLAGKSLGDLGNSRVRSYCGGFPNSLPAQDIRRMLPGIRVLGTGWTHPPLLVRQYLKATYLLDTEVVALQTSWWADMELNPTPDIQRKMVSKSLSAEEEYLAGLETARAAFEQRQALPRFVRPPRFPHAAAAAFLDGAGQDAFTTSANADSATPGLKTLRGLGPLQVQ
jgi:hypothetical protein